MKFLLIIFINLIVYPGFSTPNWFNSHSPGSMKLSVSHDVFIGVQTGSITSVGITSAKISCKLITDSLPAVTSLGLCWSTKAMPTIWDNSIKVKVDTNVFICNLKNLLPATVYFIRSYATTINDTVYGNRRAFYTHNERAVADIDSNYYNSIRIGSQTWLAEDLKTTRLNDGTRIDLIEGNTEWRNSKTPAWCWYANDSSGYSFPHGRIYNYYSVSTGKICPAGWHVPSNADWTILQNSLGGDSIAGGKLKTTGTIFWRDPNRGATNESGFSAIPGGFRMATGSYRLSTMINNWWSSDIEPPDAAYNWFVYFDQKRIYKEFSFKMFGYSIRCLKEE